MLFCQETKQPNQVPRTKEETKRGESKKRTKTELEPIQYS